MRQLTLTFLIITTAAFAATPTPEQIEFFEKKVRPILVEQCYSCRGPDKQQADLRQKLNELILNGRR